MSICALMVASVLAALYAPRDLNGAASEVAAALDRFAAMADGLLMTRAESSVCWQVPFTSGGGVIIIETNGRFLSASDGTTRCMAQPRTPIRTWTLAAPHLNQSEIAELDKQAATASFSSGECVELFTVFATIEDREELLVFCRLGS
ncbi:MAG: hypothetical protein QXQ13_01515 [Thermoplasmata archaeon]